MPCLPWRGDQNQLGPLNSVRCVGTSRQLWLPSMVGKVTQRLDVRAHL